MKKFKNVYQTQGISSKIEENVMFGFNILVAIDRFKNDDWGYLSDTDKEYQKSFIDDKYFNHMGVYEFEDGERFWIMQGLDDNRNLIATVLLPSEY